MEARDAGRRVSSGPVLSRALALATAASNDAFFSSDPFPKDGLFAAEVLEEDARAPTEECPAPASAPAGEEASPVPREHDDDDLIQELLKIIESVGSFGEFRRTHRKECLSLVRWLKLMAPMLDEIEEFVGPISDAGYMRLCALLNAFVDAKKLLRCCHDGSKIYLALEGETVIGRFRLVYEKLNQALDGMPYEELGISEEVKEQVELMTTQIKRSKRRTDTQDMELVMDLLVVLSKKDDRNTDAAILERLAKKLELQTLPDLRAETMAIKKFIKENCGQNSESGQQIVDLLDKFKQVAGIDDDNGLSDLKLPNYLEKCPSLMIPNDFLCPISLEIMTDPVIVATGQTYERHSIQKWLDAGHRTCPKTRQNLSHLSLVPNYALRNLIMQWCEKNKIELLNREHQDSEQEHHKEDIPSLIENLSSIHLDLKRKAVKKIRELSKESSDNRVLIANSGGIPPLINLLSYPDPKIQEHTVTALLNLSIDEANKHFIAKEGAIPAIIEILKNGTAEAKENSAATLFSLSMLDANKVMIGNLNGIPALIDLLKDGTIRGKKDAATALFNLVLNSKNKGRALEAGIVAPLHEILHDSSLGMVDETLSIFLLLASHPDAPVEVGQLSFIQSLVEFIRTGTPKNKECALSVLLELGSQRSSILMAAHQFGVYEHLCELEKKGTSRAQRKANSLLQLMSKPGKA